MIDLGIIITGLVGVVTTAGSAWVSWFFTRKKYNAEVDNTLLENLQHSLDFYKSLSDDNRERLNIMLERNSKLEEEVLELRKSVNDLTMNICLDLTCKLRQTSYELNTKKKS